MASPIISLTEPFFLKVLQLIHQPFEGADQLERLQKSLSADLNNISATVEKGQSSVTSGEWTSLKMVLIYWADEVLTNHVSDWQDFVLEQKYFGERNRAWKFYVEAENCVPTSGPEVAELFYLAAVLGFVGDIAEAYQVLGKELPGKRFDPAEARRVWAGDLQRRIQHKSLKEIQGEPLEGSVSPLKSDTPKRLAMAAFLTSGLLLTIVCGMALKKEGDSGTSPDENHESVETESEDEQVF